jgi:hypothetical protein
MSDEPVTDGIPVVLGPLTMTWFPDGDDPGVGLVIFAMEGYCVRVPKETTGVSRAAWLQVAAVRPVTGEYRVPEVLRQVREARATLTLSEAAEKFPPSKLYAMCESITTDAMALGGLYIHVMIEAGFYGEEPEPDFATFAVCPICGFVF